jgi:hypothetical protein
MILRPRPVLISRAALNTSNRRPLSPSLHFQLPRRSFASSPPSRSVLSAASDFFLAIPDRLPFHPSYASIIIVSTVLLRLAISVPITEWQKQRMLRLSVFVMPQVNAMLPRLISEAHTRAKSYDQMQIILKKIVRWLDVYPHAHRYSRAGV